MIYQYKKLIITLEDDSVLGYLTADEVFKRFKYCYEHNTDIYVKEALNNE